MWISRYQCCSLIDFYHSTYKQKLTGNSSSQVWSSFSFLSHHTNQLKQICFTEWHQAGGTAGAGKQKQRTRRVKAQTDCCYSWWNMTGWSRGWVCCNRGKIFLQILRPSSWTQNLCRKNCWQIFWSTVGNFEQKLDTKRFCTIWILYESYSSIFSATYHHGYQMSSTQSQNVIVCSSRQLTTPHPPQFWRLQIWMIVLQLQHKMWAASILKKPRILHCYKSDIVHYIFYTTNQSLQFTYTRQTILFVFPYFVVT